MKQEKAVTIGDVAKAAGVSKSTVSQFLNKRYEYMSGATKEKIEKVIEELNFQPNHFASNLRKKKTVMVGIIVANIQHVFSTEIIRIIEKTLQDQDIQVIICNADDDPAKEESYINLLAGRNVDGLVVFPTGANFNVYNRLLQDKIPVVFIDRKLDGLLVDTVLLDNEAASFLAVSTLADRGYKEIAIVTLPTTYGVSPRVERIEGYKKALNFLDVEVKEELICTAPLIEIRNELKRMFNRETKPNGIIAGNDLVLKEVLLFIKEKNLSIPDQVAVIGIDDVSYADIYDPPLTTIAQPTQEMAQKAAEILISNIKSGLQNVPIVYRFSPELKLRNSC